MGFAELEGLEDTKHGAGPLYMRTEGVGAQMSGFGLSAALTHTRKRERSAFGGRMRTAESILELLWSTAVRDVEAPQDLGKELEWRMADH